MYGLTKDQVGLANINGNAGGFGTAAAIYQGDKKLASGSTVNSNQPNATTGENTTAKRKSEDDKAKDTAEIIKQGFIEAMTSEEVRKVQAEQSKMTGDAINDKLMG
jgi:2,3-bisphosphoglycerate-independent phosphoglycerate mutase